MKPRVLRKENQKTTLWEAVDRILWEDWDPIGVNDNAAARNEYSGYVGSVTKLLRGGADTFKLTQHLDSLERVSMGLGPDTGRNRLVAEKLREALRSCG